MNLILNALQLFFQTPYFIQYISYIKQPESHIITLLLSCLKVDSHYFHCFINKQSLKKLIFTIKIITHLFMILSCLQVSLMGCVELRQFVW